MTGGKGRIGKYLAEQGVKELSCNVTDIQDVDDTVSKTMPDFIIHLAAISDVDYCEKKENADQVIYTNFIGTDNVCSVAEKYGARVVLLSSDHVFSGKRWLPWHFYHEKSSPLPANFYGLSKLAAEGLQALYPNTLKIVRTSYLFDKERLDGILESSYPSFIYRSFMYIPHFVRRLMLYVDRFNEMPPIVHITGSEIVSWYKFMGEYLQDADIKFHTKDLNVGAPRPHNGGLTTKYKFFFPVSYRDGLSDMELDNLK